MAKLSDTSIPWDDYFGSRVETRQRYQITIHRNSLSSYDRKKVDYALNSSSPRDAIRRAESVLLKGDLSYYAKEFLNALIISAEADINV